MGFGVRAYVVDIGRLTSAIGGKDRGLLRSVTATCADMIEDMDHLAYEDDDDPDAKERGGLRAMITALIEGDFGALDEADGLGRAGLGYALECLSAHLSGGPLFRDAFTEIDGDWLREQPVLCELAGRPGPLTGRMPFPEDFPAICVIGNRESPVMLSAAQTARDGNSETDSRPCYDELIAWLATAHAEGKGLVTFCY
jgi:hypothetical protein